MTWRWLVVLAIGCNEIYGLAPTKTRDASVFDLVDTDGDGIVDLQDNCPDHPNADQGDSDGDLRGDLCDDCPLVSNEQGIDADGDGLGDVCDPHPASPGDCLLALDTFADPSTFAANWKVSASESGVVIPERGTLRLRPTTGTPIIEVTSSTSPDATDVMVQGIAPPPTAGGQYPSVSAFVAHETSSQLYACRLFAPSDLTAYGPGAGLPTTKSLVPASPINHKFVIRLITFEAEITNSIDVLCRVDYGVAVGTDTRVGQQRVIGAPGFSAGASESTLDAIALSKFQPGVACPPTLIR